MLKFKNLLFLSVLMLVFNALNILAQVPPTLVYPPNGDNCVNKNATFEWSPVTNAVSYRFEVYDSPDLINPIISLTNLTVTNATVELPAWQSTYYWRAISVFANNNLGIANPFSFTTKIPPLNLVTPVNNTVCADTIMQFKWNKADAEFYHLQVSENLNFDTLAFDRNNIIDTFFTVRLPKYSKTYYWRVASKKSLCQTEYSEVRNITTKQATALLVSPADKSTGAQIFTNSPFSINLVWKKFGQGYTYDLEVSRNSSFTDNLVTILNTVDTSYVLNIGNEFDSTYYWRVRTRLDGCISYWSETFSFKTPYMPTILLLPAEASTCVSMLNTLFRWNKINTADKYRIQVSDTVSFSRILVDSTGISDTLINLNLNKAVSWHYWRIKAEDNNNTGLWSDIHSFLTTQSAPVVIAPTNEQLGLRKTITAEWIQFDAGETFEIKVYFDKEMSTVILDTTGLDTNKFTFTVPNDNHIYYWQIRAKFGTCYGDWSQVFQFRTSIQSPTLLVPENKAINVSFNPIYEWEPVEDAISYEIEISRDAKINQRLVSEKGITSTIWTYPGLQYQEKATYYWRVRAANNDGVSLWSEIFSFTIKEKPASATQLIEPANNASKVELNPTFTWQSAENAVSYLFTIASDANFENIYFNQATPDTTIEIAGLERFAYYWWKVKSIGADGEGDFSDTFIFRTKDIAPVDPAQLLFPEDNAINQNIFLVCSWKSVDRALAYKLQVATNSNFAENTFVADHPSVKDTLKNISALEYNKKYYWRVAAWNEDGDAPWSPVREFNTSLNASVRNSDANISSHSINPNPVSDMINLQIEAIEYSNSYLSITDLSGKVVFEINNMELYDGMNHLSFNINHVPAGTYFYSVKSNTGIISGKFIKE